MTSNTVPLRSLGKTGLLVSRLGLGLAALGRPAYINLGRSDDIGLDRPVSEFERRTHAVLDAAYAAGIRYIDAARSYGLAEAFLSSWLEARKPSPEALTIGSKWGYTYVGSWRVDAPVHEVKDLSVETLRRQSAESRALLGHWLRLYQIHSATLESGVLDDPHLLEELGTLRAEGLTIGVTVSGPRQADVIRRAMQVNVSGTNPFQVVQATWNLLEPSAGPALADAKAQGWGVIVKEALANGRLSDRHSEGRVALLTQRAHAQGTTTDALALAAGLLQPWADVILSGAVTVEQLRSNLTAISLAESGCDWPTLAEPTPEYWANRSAQQWQ